MSFKIVRNDITKMNTEAIVNTANSRVVVGSGCDRAVYTAAGHEELLKYREENVGNVPEGEAFVTPGFRLPAKYIIHAVSPRYKDGDGEVEEKLRSCYRKSLQLAKSYGIRSIAFPLISTGSFGYPKEEGMRIAVDEISLFLQANDLEIILVVFDSAATRLGTKIYPDLEAYIDQNYVEEVNAEEYGKRRELGGWGRTSEPMPGLNAPDMSASGSFSRKMLSSVEFSAPNMASSDDFAAPSSRVSREPSVSGAIGFATRSIFKKKESAELYDEGSIPAEASFMPEPDDADYDFEEIHTSKLEERMQHMSDTYSEYLMYLIKERNMENADVWKRAIVDKKIFSKIKNNVNYHPNKLTALCLCVGAKLNLDESRDLLARAGYALSPCDKTDIIFSYFIENEIYDMIELDIQLEEHGLPCIIS